MLPHLIRIFGMIKTESIALESLW